MLNSEKIPVSNKESGVKTDRREFLIRSSKAGLLILSSCAAGYLFYNRNNFQSPAYKKEAYSGLPDFSVKDAGRKMAVIKGDDRIKTINLGFKAIGGIEKFIKKGDRVLLKSMPLLHPRLFFQRPPTLSSLKKLQGFVMRRVHPLFR